MLRQRLEAGDLKVEMKEIALTDRSTMIEYTVTNGELRKGQLYRF